eukprot:Hpha_TRINITY_DN1590_c0_g1::TRINITY_DN1590_c0_g1_i1::g.57285::m.57285
MGRSAVLSWLALGRAVVVTGRAASFRDCSPYTDPVFEFSASVTKNVPCPGIPWGIHPLPGGGFLSACHSDGLYRCHGDGISPQPTQCDEVTGVTDLGCGTFFVSTLLKDVTILEQGANTKVAGACDLGLTICDWDNAASYVS